MASFYKVNKSNASAMNCRHHHNYNRVTLDNLSPSRFLPSYTHINKEEEAGRQPGFSPYSGPPGRQVVTATEGFGRTNSNAVNGGGREREGADRYFIFSCICSSCHLPQLLPPWCSACTGRSRQHSGFSRLTHTEELPPHPTALK